MSRLLQSLEETYWLLSYRTEQPSYTKKTLLEENGKIGLLENSKVYGSSGDVATSAFDWASFQTTG